MDEQVLVSEIVRNWAIVVGGALALGLAAWRTWSLARQADANRRQSEIADRSHVSVVLKDAVGLLGDEKLEVRLGAIISLEQIAATYPDLKPPIRHLLFAYVREQTTRIPDEGRDRSVGSDIQQIMRFLREGS